MGVSINTKMNPHLIISENCKNAEIHFMKE